jgi:hypothetical protein
MQLTFYLERDQLKSKDCMIADILYNNIKYMFSKTFTQTMNIYNILASISSRERPLVSGTMKYMKRRDAMAITPNPANRTPVPTNACYKKKIL